MTLNKFINTLRRMDKVKCRTAKMPTLTLGKHYAAIDFRHMYLGTDINKKWAVQVMNDNGNLFWYNAETFLPPGEGES